MKDLLYILGMLAIALFLYLGMHCCIRETKREYFGKRVILENDTVTILDYDPGTRYIEGGYVLSNGMTVNDAVIKNSKIID